LLLLLRRKWIRRPIRSCAIFGSGDVAMLQEATVQLCCRMAVQMPPMKGRIGILQWQQVDEVAATW